MMIFSERMVFYTLEKAQRCAAILQADDLFWTYKVHDGINGMARIDLYDEDGELIHKGMPID